MTTTSEMMDSARGGASGSTSVCAIQSEVVASDAAFRAAAPSGMLLRRLGVDRLFREGRQFLVGLFLLRERRFQEGCERTMPEPLAPGDERAIARDLVVLDRLRRGNERGIEHRLVVDLARHLLRFLENAVDRRT